ncbi:MAG: hypothetical protein ACTTJE_00330 [Schwartzia sp. (in: firmicutes)]
MADNERDWSAEQNVTPLEEAAEAAQAIEEPAAQPQPEPLPEQQADPYAGMAF